MNTTPTDQFRAAMRHLVEEKGRGTQARISETTGIDKGQLNGIIKGRSPASEDSRMKISEYFNRTYEDMLALGRQILSGQSASSPIANTKPAPPLKGMVPLISWVQAGGWTDIEDTYHPGDAADWLPTNRKYGPHAFALKVRGDSMAPRFPEDCIIIVDPDYPHDNLSFVVAKLNGDDTTTFKQLVIDAGQVFLKPLNERYPMLDVTNRDWKICGVVREMRMVEEF